ncbi:hypothetical protein [Devosia nitrariae]|uniref:Uncharacterized protein n=1 Tax=Devosia nitrariae TaxID=2071872 RepID=A0ABQ5WCH0_9HYPH|nr:hypothetical protein [Devosia nitrariae]GLQ57573.1 hypothetical protein GCM10010862_48320 [Devosia nitrariae]
MPLMRMAPAPNTALAGTTRPTASAIAYNLAGLAVLAALVAVAAAYLLDFHMASHSGPPPAQTMTTLVSRTIGGRELRIPLDWFRGEASPKDEFASQVELRAALALEGLDRPATIDVTLLPRSRVRPSAMLLDTVYLRDFGSETLRGAPGLVGKRLLPERGLGETVWYDPLSPAPFVAKCMAPVETGAPGRCLRSVVLPSGVGAVYAFDDTVLEGWMGFDAVVKRMMTTIGAW